MDAIVYTSNTGFTEKYAKLLGGKLFLPVYSLEEAKGKLAAGAEIIYLGWLMAGTVKGYKPAVRRYRIRAVGAVGMAANLIICRRRFRYLPCRAGMTVPG